MHFGKFLLAGFSLHGSVVADPLVVQTSNGPVQGAVRGAGIAWLGVPFGGDTSIKRFSAPVAPKPWTEVRDATAFGPGCVQSTPYTGPGSGSPRNQSEDCLNVNIYAPANWTPGLVLPTYVFIYGGAFILGCNDCTRDLYEADELANSQNIVVFVPNYRLEAFGFLVLPGTDILGNFGIMDQTFALKWVNQNAAAFGADPKRITLGGQSAGAMSTGIHMVSPGSRGLFHRAIMESNVGGFKYKAVDEQTTIANAMVQATSCPYWSATYSSIAECLRGLTSSEIKAATAKASGSQYNIWGSLIKQWGHILDIVLPWTPTVGTDIFPMQVQDAFAQGKASYMPLFFGTVHDEGWTFVAETFGKHVGSFTGLGYPIVVDVMFTGDSAAVKAQYPHIGIFEGAGPQLGNILTDFWFKCGSQKLGFENHKNGQPTWNYRHVHPMSEEQGKAYYPALPIQCVNHTCHTSDVPVFMGSIKYSGTMITEKEKVIVKQHMDYIGSFINGGTPGSAGVEPWPTFDENRNDLLIGDVIMVESERKLCEFWDSIGYPKLEPKMVDSNSIHV